MTRGGYTRVEFALALESVGVRSGDVVFTHSNVGFFGLASGPGTSENALVTILGAVNDIVGDAGTIVVPTFTLSFCRSEVFDVANSESNCGAYAEFVRRQTDSVRSTCPLFSVAAVGNQKLPITASITNKCFGAGSVWDRLIEHDAIVCNFNLDAGSTLIHHVEWRLGVPYRQDRLFHGTTVENGMKREATAVYFSRDLVRATSAASFERFDRLARDRGVARTARIGRGSIVAIRARDVLNLIEETLPLEPLFLTAAGAVGSTNVQHSGRH